MNRCSSERGQTSGSTRRRDGRKRQRAATSSEPTGNISSHGLDDDAGNVTWHATLPDEQEWQGYAHGWNICLECGDGIVTNLANRRTMPVSWPNLPGLRVFLAQNFLDGFVSQGNDPEDVLAELQGAFPDSEWFHVLKLKHEGKNHELAQMEAEGAETVVKIQAILDKIDRGGY